MAFDKTPKELNDIGDSFFYGLGESKNIEIAFTYYKQAADQNNPVGLYNVSKYFIEKKDFKQGLEYLKKAAYLDYPQAYIKLSDIYLNGLGVRKNKAKAFKYLEHAAKLNEVESYHLLGKFYLYGIGTNKNESKAYALFNNSAKANNTEGMFLLADLLLTGKKVKNDFETAFFYFDKAASSNNVLAINKLKELYKKPHPYLKKHSDIYRQEMWFYYDELLANLDDIEALKRCAFAYYKGNEFVKVNYEKSIKYFKTLHKLDDQSGYLGLGLSFLYGQGVEIDLERARDYLEIASTRNDALAKNALGDIYRLGKGVESNFNRAKDYYLEAAKQEEVDALINLGLLHYRKQIKNATDMLAHQYMVQASKKNNPNAFYWLGIFNDKGIGCNKSFDEAKKFFEKAIKFGNIGAKYKLATMIYEDTKNLKQSKKKLDKQYLEIRDLLVEYINNPIHQEINGLYSMYTLGELYTLENFSLKSMKISRYYFEKAASKNFGKAMVRMYDILKDKEPNQAMNYLNKACEKPSDGEELFKLSIVYEQGLHGVIKDKVKSRKLLDQSAKLNYPEAIKKVTMS